jgi:hypothetical protein
MAADSPNVATACRNGFCAFSLSGRLPSVDACGRVRTTFGALGAVLMVFQENALLLPLLASSHAQADGAERLGTLLLQESGPLPEYDDLLRRISAAPPRPHASTLGNLPDKLKAQKPFLQAVATFGESAAIRFLRPTAGWTKVTWRSGPSCCAW